MNINLINRANTMVNPHSVAFRLKVLWFKDILKNSQARQFLWSLYYAGEAYEELHNDAVYVEKLPGKWGKLLAKHLQDETRHATVFRELLREEGCVPQPLNEVEDLGYFLLTHVVPDVVMAGKRGDGFTNHEAIRYLAFLHSLELRSIGDLSALRIAAEECGESYVVECLGKILKDEVFHATYTNIAVWELSGSEQLARETLQHIVHEEQYFYHIVIKHLIERFEQLGTRPGEWSGKMRWKSMKWAARHGLAFPSLPVYRRVPKHIN
jgi:hypothetical protein